MSTKAHMAKAADIQKQIKLLESDYTTVSEDARQALSTNLGMGLGIVQLVYYYAENRSERALDLLCKVREPYDQNLMNAMIETMKNRKYQETYILLGLIIQESPSWIPKIPKHALFQQILEHIRKLDQSDTSMADCIAGLLVISLLLPHCPGLSKDALGAILGVFTICAEIFAKRGKQLDRETLVRGSSKRSISSRDIEKVNNAHLAFAIRECFHTLYGIYPSNTMTHLKNHFQNLEQKHERYHRLKVVVTSLLTGVRAHPNLILMNKDAELHKDRGFKKEPHDFLDDCRRVVIGVIPIQTRIGDGDMCSEPDSPSVMPVRGLRVGSFFTNLFSNDDDSSDITTEIKQNVSLGAGGPVTPLDFADDGGLMASINTPPGSVPGTPTQKRSMIGVDDPVLITVSDERQRTTSGRSEHSSFRIMNLFRKNTNVSERRHTVSRPLSSIEVIEGEDDIMQRRISEGTELDEAEEATGLDACKADGIQADVLISPLSRRSVVRTDPVDQRDNGLELARAANAASRAAKERKAANAALEREAEEFPVTRSRSTSFLCGPGPSDDRDRASTAETNVDCSEMSEPGENACSEGVEGSGRANRFSVSSFFSKYNRQRFVSECPAPDADPCENNKSCISGSSTKNLHIFERTWSCPNLAREEMASIEKIRHEMPSAQTPSIPLEEQFPYLKLVRPYANNFYSTLEKKLEDEHMVRREKYMDASQEFHHCLVELGLADKLPGRIYDDMNHITQGLDAEKQASVLRARLQLVNQHLLYERSCRLLHANRNRRLFGRLSRQGQMRQELTTLKENLYRKTEEYKELISALTDLRKLSVRAKTEAKQEFDMMTNKIKQMKQHENHLEQELEMARSRAKIAEDRAMVISQRMDSSLRRADDAEAVMQTLQEKLRMSERVVEDIARTKKENSQLKSLVHCLETRLREEDRLRTPDTEEPGGLSSKECKSLHAELEKIRKERDAERWAREEAIKRCQDIEAGCQQEINKSSELKTMLDRAGRLLKEQQDAAEQKFLSLQAVTYRQEQHITQLNSRLEELSDTGLSPEPLPIPQCSFPPEITSYQSCASDVYFPREVVNNYQNPYGVSYNGRPPVSAQSHQCPMPSLTSSTMERLQLDASLQGDCKETEPDIDMALEI